ncbi:DUF4174 domain-containing protein [Phaeobacter sp. QD34_3]|uniref:DUF4174 domain-containing protein n=1 Tax=unclassified Phaeobacter TaxID=2621772 RepID=UPI00237FAAD0|nr:MULTISPECIES: DUF4174 domain-containing protein [unclassified Phaeobacter]MDE4131946.1 DUF4174 domain-containing protein [Phaeobacter sp. QD34_3]MDE4135584.1 DUF4174 domain-containing protein [Phaeobacter sp. QD34_24]MDE4173573.1 DUF4174 domain-containing protein [Phaeobacter sp. PT47_59]
MKPILALVLTAFLPTAVLAEDTAQPDAPAWILPEYEGDLSAFLWHNRPVVVFADSAEDPRFQDQLQRLEKGAEDLLERDVVVLTDTDPGKNSELRKKLRPRGFMLVLVGKDGGVKLRKPHPWSVRELSRTIDKFPSRLREVEERRGS